MGTFSIVPLIVDAVDHTPVMAAGGIADSRAFNAAFALGAEGDMNNGYVSVGHGISHIHEIKSVKEIIREMTKAIQ